MALGKRIEQRRNSLAWTQQHLCDLVDKLAGQEEALSQQRLDRLEKRDSNKVETEIAAFLAEALGVSLRWLCNGEGRLDEPEWPFRLVQRARWDQCDVEERGYVQMAMNRALDDCEQKRAPWPPSSKQGLLIA